MGGAEWTVPFVNKGPADCKLWRALYPCQPHKLAGGSYQVDGRRAGGCRCLSWSPGRRRNIEPCKYHHRSQL